MSDHSHHHHHPANDGHPPGMHQGLQPRSDGGLIGAIVINLLLTVAQVVGGIFSGSLSLIADALHNLSDAGSLLIAFIARRIARRPPDKQHTYGYRRVEVVGAMVNTTTLVLIGLYLIYEAIMRFANPSDIKGVTVMAVASVALVIDLATAFLVMREAKDNLNMKAALVHNLADAAGSIVVIGVGVVTWIWEVNWVDPAATLLLALVMIYHGATMFKDAADVLVDRVPSELDYDTVRQAMLAISGIQDVHHLHIRYITETVYALECHLVVSSWDVDEIEKIKQNVRQKMADTFSIVHTTLEFESSQESVKRG